MIRILSVVGVVGSALLVWMILAVVNVEPRSPLELPPSAQAGPPGGAVAGDCFVWMLDRSCSMGWGGTLATLKAEVTSAISSLSPSAEFSVLPSAATTDVWSYAPRRASPVNKDSATLWVDALVAGGGTCMADAGVQSLQLAARSTRSSKSVIVMGDGEPFCGGSGAVDTLTAMFDANVEEIPIHAVYFGSSASGISFFQSLAAQSGGTFIIIP